MPAKKYIIRLSAEERAELERVSRSHRRSEREKKRARILLLCDTGVSREEGGSYLDEGGSYLDEGGSYLDEAITTFLGCGRLTVARVRQRAIERGALASLTRQEQLNRKERVLEGAGEAALVALTCSALPQGEARWSLRLLREKLIEMEVVENIGTETIRQTLKKTRSSRG
jgi:hypothetical protein